MGAFVRYTVPIILTSLLQLLFNAADLIVVGRFCGQYFCGCRGCHQLPDQFDGEFLHRIVRRDRVTVAHVWAAGRECGAPGRPYAIPTAIISGVILTILGVSCSGFFLKRMGTPQTVLPLSSVYMKIYFSGITFTMLYNFSASILRAAGDTKVH